MFRPFPLIHLLARPALVPLVLLLAATTFAQAPTPGPSSKVDSAELQRRLEEIDSNTELETSVVSRTGYALRTALEQLDQAQGWRDKLAEFSRMVEEAPAMLTEARAELAEPIRDPEIPEAADVTQLQLLYDQTQAELTTRRGYLVELEAEPQRRAKRRVEIPQELAVLRERLGELAAEIALPLSTTEPPEVAYANKALARARHEAFTAQVAALEKELAAYDAREELLQARRERTARRVARTEKLAKALQEKLTLARRREAQIEAGEARNVEREQQAAGVPEIFRELAATTADLTERRIGPSGIVAKIDRTQSILDKRKVELLETKESLDSIRARIDIAGLTNTIGLMLRNRRETLLNPRQLKQRLKAHQKAIQDAQLAEFELQEQQRELINIEAQVVEVMAQVPLNLGETELEKLENDARSLLNRQREVVDKLLLEQKRFFRLLVETEDIENQLLKLTEEYLQYIDENVLWVRSSTPLRFQDFPEALEATRWLFNWQNWKGVFRDLRASFSSDALAHVLLIIVFVLWGLALPRIRKTIRQIGEKVMIGASPSLRPTFEVLIFSLLLAIYWPLIIAYIAQALQGPLAADFTRAIGYGLMTSAVVFSRINILRQFARPKGLGQAHFTWSNHSLEVIRKNTMWLICAGFPLASIAMTIESQPTIAYRESLGQFALVAGLLLLLYFAHRVLRPTGGVLEPLLKTNPDSLFARTRKLWYGLAMLCLSALVILAALGYTYSAIQIIARIINSLSALLFVLVGHGITMRGIRLARRRLYKKQVEERKAALEETARVEIEPGERPSVQPVPEVDLSVIDIQTKSILRSVMLIAIVVSAWFIWVDVLPALNILNKVELPWQTAVVNTVVTTNDEGIKVSEQVETSRAVTLGDLTLALIVLGLMIAGARNLPGLTELILLQRLPFEAGARYAIRTIIQYVIVLVGLVAAFTIMGVGWGKLQWLVAAVSVGLGFGLQEIFANFVSGLIILFEQPIRVGDVVTISGTSGTVSRIRIRATTIINFDRQELIVPNREFITGQVINWSLSSPVLRLTNRVGVSYEADVNLVVETLKEVAKDSPDVLDDPPSNVFFAEFGDSTLNFELRFFIDDTEHWIRVKHRINMRIIERFREEGIEIAFPQRDLHIRSSSVALTRDEKSAEERILEEQPQFPKDAAE